MTFRGRRRQPVPGRGNRRGTVLAKLIILLPVLVGFVGLTVDGGLMLSSARQAQNAADAAATAAAMDLLRGQSAERALETANRYIQEENGLADAAPLVAGTTFNIPPQSGPYEGEGNYVEVIVNVPYQTLFMHVLVGEGDEAVGARAVAGYEPVTAGKGVMALDSDPEGGSGLVVGGNAELRVDGRIVVNSAHGGVDENGLPVEGLSVAPAAAVENNDGIYATRVDVVGGVSSPEKFHPYVAGDPAPLQTGIFPEPDPLLNLPIPTIATGVDTTKRGSVSIRNGSVSGIATGGYVSGTNSRAVGGERVANGLHTASADEVILHPGIYNSMKITGGTVYMIPGIYVLAGGDLEATGGTILAENVMIYNTGDNYNPADGSPDIYDGGGEPAADGANFGEISINTSIISSPIDTERVSDVAGGYHLLYAGAKPVSSEFDGMFFFQRRHNVNPIKIVGNADDGELTGTVYAKWAPIEISGQGAYQAQFLVGTLKLTGNGRISILGAGDKRGRANNVFLVE